MTAPAAVDFTDEHLGMIIDMVRSELRATHEMEMRGGMQAMGQISKITNIGAIAEWHLQNRAYEKKKQKEAEEAKARDPKKPEKKT